MAKRKYELWIKSKGRGIRQTDMLATGIADVKNRCKVLEYGTDVTVKTPSGKVQNFTVR